MILPLREMLAVHAPPVPDWFEPVMETKRPEGVNWKRAGRSSRPENQAEIKKWDDEYARQRHAQWPWAYADMTADESYRTGSILPVSKDLYLALKQIVNAWRSVPDDSEVPDEINDDSLWDDAATAIAKAERVHR